MATAEKKQKTDVPQKIEEVPDPVDLSIVDDNASVEEVIKESEEAMEILEPKVEAKRWVIGKPPERGGKSTEYSIYVQQPLGYMARNRLFALIGRTMSAAIRQSGGSVGGMDDIFGMGSGSIIERGRRLASQDLADASQFFSLAMELVGYSPEFLGEFYAIVLEVPYGDRGWFKQVIEQPYRPDEDKWGMEEDAGVEIIHIFIDQNYEDIRRFFVVKLPQIAKRANQREQELKETTEKSESTSPSLTS